jgi:hypothetical protein
MPAIPGLRPCVERGESGTADRLHLMAGNDPIIKRPEVVNAIAPQVPDPKKPR